MDFKNEFADKKVIVTGACGIIGGWITKAFAEAGAQLCLTDHRAEALAATVGIYGDQAFGITTNLMSSPDMDRFAAEIAKRWGAPDILVNNAGIYPSGFLLDMDIDDFDAIMGVNLRAPFYLSKLFARQMVGKGVKGSIVNISSGAARKMRRTAVTYSTSKTALDRLTKGFAIELAEYGIRVNIVEPGFAAGSSVSALSKEHIKTVTDAIPLGRASSSDDVSNAVLFLSSSAASYITGATLAVDGGNSIGSLAVYQDKKKAL
ncbi:SDR family NAD(P)-dependent oxidoreductase [Aliirhizobium cellulosilyticum]|uniref:3-oxoacyl-[acyl-carrier protein] reductase n=1 Tax=Aliirhizobium cellulosilyticum TaxID=393664 RepID=A0A7W6WQZ9_9HYPH|nr:SDR family oxidoreductase [Rhizobium cellulosilyticum]MBB4349983.1 3-oxoacyl-[acyl-carrier protein] reductase [Rhizobium cellulosilyticum]MBB4413162.1 3-oxoacyl-[acyl-carrier protein] reductase [Rhizobium cellulosilyticum]MBB4447900.1 3-oxoacyl-[acyl-carrier protein] reductase [Rhizobium cellulosilyticum]